MIQRQSTSLRVILFKFPQPENERIYLYSENVSKRRGCGNHDELHIHIFVNYYLHAIYYRLHKM